MKNPINTLTKKTRKLLVHWKKKKFITDQTYKKLLCTDGILPRIYVLLKIYKSDCPFRIIISGQSIISVHYILAAFLHEIIVRRSPKLASHIENSFQLIQKIQSTVLDNDFPRCSSTFH